MAADVRVGAEIGLLGHPQTLVERQGVAAEVRSGAQRVIHLVGVATADRSVDGIYRLPIVVLRCIEHPLGYRERLRLLGRAIKRCGVQSEPHQRKTTARFHACGTFERRRRFVGHETDCVQAILRCLSNALQCRTDFVEHIRADDFQCFAEHKAMRKSLGRRKIENELHGFSCIVVQIINDLYNLVNVRRDIQCNDLPADERHRTLPAIGAVVAVFEAIGSLDAHLSVFVAGQPGRTNGHTFVEQLDAIRGAGCPTRFHADLASAQAVEPQPDQSADDQQGSQFEQWHGQASFRAICRAT
jgi:hypothetical protein